MWNIYSFVFGALHRVFLVIIAVSSACASFWHSFLQIFTSRLSSPFSLVINIFSFLVSNYFSSLFSTGVECQIGFFVVELLEKTDRCVLSLHVELLRNVYHFVVPIFYLNYRHEAAMRIQRLFIQNISILIVVL